jgi:hypothetical protein
MARLTMCLLGRAWLNRMGSACASRCSFGRYIVCEFVGRKHDSSDSGRQLVSSVAEEVGEVAIDLLDSLSDFANPRVDYRIRAASLVVRPS